MFPYQSCELSFQIPNNNDTNATTTIGTISNNNNNNNNNSNSYYQQKVELDMRASPPLPLPLPPPPPSSYQSQLATDSLTFGSLNTRKGRPRKTLTNLHNNNDGEDQDEICGNDTAKRRTIHRDIERLRRQEMSNLYSSLRSLLPMEYIKGKRSMCDHITEAARYIKDLEKNVKELGDNKDKLKGSSSSNSTPRSRSSIDCNVSIHKFSKAVEVEINVGLEDEEVNVFPLSRVIELLIEEGVDVVNYVSSRVNQRRIYVIHGEVNDVTSIDSHQLQRKLMSEIGS